jgi:hypothetical protein
MGNATQHAAAASATGTEWHVHGYVAFDWGEEVDFDHAARLVPAELHVLVGAVFPASIISVTVRPGRVVRPNEVSRTLEASGTLGVSAHAAYVVRAEHLPRELLHQVVLLVGALGRGEDTEGVAAELLANRGQRVGHEVQRLVPIQFNPRAARAVVGTRPAVQQVLPHQRPCQPVRG